MRAGRRPKINPKRLEVAVFPLVNTVLFPGVTLPLQIYESCHEQMLKDIQQRKLPLAVSLAIPKKGQTYSFSPICGAGTVQVFQEHPNGHSEILVHGTQRVKLCSVIQSEPYYLMEAEVLQAEIPAAPTTLNSFESFRALIKAWVFLNPKILDEWTLAFDGFATFGELTDFFVFHFLKKARDKQKYLNCTNPLQRAESLASFLEQDLIRLGSVVEKERPAQWLH